MRPWSLHFWFEKWKIRFIWNLFKTSKHREESDQCIFSRFERQNIAVLWSFTCRIQANMRKSCEYFLYIEICCFSSDCHSHRLKLTEKVVFSLIARLLVHLSFQSFCAHKFVQWVYTMHQSLHSCIYFRILSFIFVVGSASQSTDSWSISKQATQRLPLLSSLDIFNRGSAIGYRKLCQILDNAVLRIAVLLISRTFSEAIRKEYEFEGGDNDCVIWLLYMNVFNQ
jgi:hypothetical protein